MGAIFGRTQATAAEPWSFGEMGASSYPDISIPEGLHTLAHGPRQLKVAAAGALSEVVNGEVQVLEEILDEAKCVHVPMPSDGRNLFAVLIDELVVDSFEGAEALAVFLERCTAYDHEWDDEDEWNAQVVMVQEFLKTSPGIVAALARAKAKQSGMTATLLDVILKRLAGDKKAAAPAEVATQKSSNNILVAISLRLLSRLFSPFLSILRRLTGWPKSSSSVQAPPEVMSVNTRVQCAVCQEYTKQPVVCPICRDATYVSQEHLESDRKRHSTWCFKPRGT